jgi:hypothetical protein
VGPGQLSFGVHAGAQFNDNINASQIAPQEDTILNAGVNFGLLWPVTDNSILHLGSGILRLQYLKHSANSSFEITPDSALTWQVGFGDATLTLFDQFNYWQQAAQNSALANVVSLPRLDNTVGARVGWEPGQWLLQVGYSYDYFASTSTADEYLDQDSQYVFMRDAWRFAENTQAGIEASLGLTDYLHPIQAGEPSGRSVSVGPYGEWQVTQAVTVTARGGEVVQTTGSSSAGAPGSTFSSYYYGLDASHRLTDFFSHQVSIARNTTLGINQGSSYIEETSASYSGSLSVTPRISLGAGFTYAMGNQPLAAVVYGGYNLQGKPKYSQGTLTENFDTYGAGPTLTWRATDKLSSSFSYSWLKRTSNLGGRAYVQNGVSLNLSYNFW